MRIFFIFILLAVNAVASDGLKQHETVSTVNEVATEGKNFEAQQLKNKISTAEDQPGQQGEVKEEYKPPLNDEGEKKIR